MVTKMGCEVIPHSELVLPKLSMTAYHRFLKRTKLEVLKVPTRMRGLTSSGSRGNCYYNVENLVDTFGGNVVVGWFVALDFIKTEYKGKDAILCNIGLGGHAAWLNREGRLSDPTAKSWHTPGRLFFQKSGVWGAIKENDKIYHQFVPLKVGTIHDCYGCHTVQIECVVDHKMRILRDWEVNVLFQRIGDVKIPLRWNEINPEMIENMIVYKLDWDKQFKSWDDYKEFRYRKGKFTEVSLRSGKSLEEIRAIKEARDAA